MIKFTKNCFWITLLLVMFCISFNLKSDEVEVISIDPYIIEKTLSGTPAPTIPFYPAGITDIKIFHADELAVYIRSFHTERSLQAKISLLVDNKNIEEQALTLPPTKTITAQFKLPFVLSSRHEVKLILNFDKPKDLFEWEKVINFNPREKVEIFDILKFTKVPLISFKVQIDGDISEWKKNEPLVLNRKEDVFPEKDRGKWQGVEDLSSKIYLGWDKNYFYLAAEIKDDKHFNLQSSNTLWDGDAIQFAFAPSSLGKVIPINLGMAFAKGRPAATKWGRGGSSRLVEKSRYAVKRDEEKKVTYYEIRMPFSAIRITSGKGQMFGFNIAVFDDDDGKGHKLWMQLAPGLADGIKPEQFKNYILWE